MVASRREVLPGLAVQMEARCDGLPRSPLDHPQADEAPGRRDGDRGVGAELLQVAAASVPRRPGADVQSRARVGLVLDDDRGVRLHGLRVGLPAEPALAVVATQRPGRDDGAQVDVDLLELAERVEPRTVGERQRQLLARASPQRMLAELGAGDGVDERA